jgi:hypothetical protein
MAWPNYSPEDDASPAEGQSTLVNTPPSERTKLMRAGRPTAAPEPIDADYEEIETGDGGVIIRFGGPELLQEDDGDTEGGDPEADAFYGNLADHMSDGDLSTLAYELIEEVETDIQKMSVWIANYERGIDLLGIKVKQPRGETSGEGVSQVDHPLLLDACIGGASTALGELLPADGPVKIDNSGRATAITDKQAKKLEKSMNDFLTSKSPEYYPDTDQMLFQWYFGGMGIKKVYHCPLRRRPVSDAVKPGDFIVSNDATSVQSCGRKTHRTKMRQAVMARMQYLGEYREVELMMPTDDVTGIERKVDQVQGLQSNTDRVEDTEHTIYEIYTDRVIVGDEHKEGSKVTGLPRPYIITLEKDTRVVLSIRRNWRMDDENFTERRRFVAYRLIPMFGFYASGLVNVLANSTSALTAAWRLMLDNGMFSNFPGFLYMKNGDRQLDNNFRVAPGEGVPVDVGGAEDIRNAIMALPYKEFGPSFPAFVAQVQETAAQVGGRANLPIAEGKANAPVGSMLAALEQASQMISAIHKRGHTAQAEEFAIMIELIREDPEAFVRLFTDDEDPWEEQELLDAIDNYRLTPKADPNTPTQMHRLLKGQALKQMADGAPERYDADKVDTYILEMLGFDDPQQFFSTPEQRAAMAQQPSDPSLAIAQTVAKAKEADTAAKLQIADLTNRTKVVDIRTREAIAQLNAEAKLVDTSAKIEIAQADREQKGALELLSHEVETERANVDRAQAGADAEAGRMFDQGEAEAGRQHESSRADADQKFQAKEGQATRQHGEKLAKMKPKPAGKKK